MEKEDSVWWKLGDGFIPDPYRQWLHKSIYKYEHNGKPLININGWSGMHFLSGVAAGWLGISPIVWFIIHLVWEIFQIIIGMTNICQISEIIDIAFDQTFAMLGYFAYNKLS